MNKFAYTNNFEMPTSHDIEDWKTFFEKLMSEDRLAPYYVTRYHLAIIDGQDVVTGSCEKHSWYYDIAIEISADDRYPANEAAVATGFIEKGMQFIADETISAMSAPADDGVADM